MRTARDIGAEIAKLQSEMEQVRAQEIKAAVEQVRALIREHGLTLNDLGKSVFSGRRGGPSSKSKNPPKYRDPKSGKTWSGMGKPPNWIKAAVKAGKKDEFLIGGAEPTSAAKSRVAKKTRAAAKKSGAARKTTKAAG